MVKNVINETPISLKFTDDKGKKVSVAEYYLQKYNLKIKDKAQPMLVVSALGREDIYIPPEFCVLDGIPESTRSDQFKMRNILASARKTPQEKLDSITEFSENLFS